MKKSKFVPVFLSLITLALVGCGGSRTSSTSSAASSTTSSETKTSSTTTSSAAPVTSSVTSSTTPASSEAEVSSGAEEVSSESSAEEDSHTYVFEAEDTDLTDKKGLGYSGSATEAELIAYCKTCGASNDRYLTYLYKTGLSIDFVIEVTEDVKNVDLYLRLSCEMKDITIDSDVYSVQVTTPDNSTRAYTYDDISLSWSGDKSVPATFQDFLISSKVSLKQGSNTISLITNNSTSLGGTTGATAPLVDCIKLVTPDTSTSVLSMEKAEDNY